jgi:hypothetical protein
MKSFRGDPLGSPARYGTSDQLMCWQQKKGNVGCVLEGEKSSINNGLMSYNRGENSKSNAYLLSSYISFLRLLLPLTTKI